APDEGRRPDLADPDDVGKNDVEVDGARQPLELGQARVDRMAGRSAANIGHDQAGPRWRGAGLNKSMLAGAVAPALIVFSTHERPSVFARMLRIEQLDRSTGH